MGARALMIPSWTENLGALKAADGVSVYQRCGKCQVGREVELDAMIAEFGPLYSLWNRHPPCPEPGCGGQLWFRAQPKDYFHRILDGAPAYLVEPLHERWHASLPADVRDALPVIPMLRAADLCVAVGCGRCEMLVYLGPVDVGAWGEKVTLIELTARLMCRVGCEVATDLVPNRV